LENRPIAPHRADEATNVSIAKAEPLKIATDPASPTRILAASRRGTRLPPDRDRIDPPVAGAGQDRAARSIAPSSSETAGRALDSTVVVIDGATGRIVSSERIRRRMQYAPAADRADRVSVCFSR
jgi:hypothetical protein